MNKKILDLVQLVLTANENGANLGVHINDYSLEIHSLINGVNVITSNIPSSLYFNSESLIMNQTFDEVYELLVGKVKALGGMN